MSLRSLTEIAKERDAGPPKGKDGKTPQSKAETLTHAIPSEVLALYTAILALGAGLGVDEPGWWSPFLWVLYFALLGVTGGAVWYSYQQTKNPKRQAPAAELAAGLIAFGVWGLVAPGSAFSRAVTGVDQMLISGVMILIAAAVLGALPLEKKAGEPRQRPAKQAALGPKAAAAPSDPPAKPAAKPATKPASKPAAAPKSPTTKTGGTKTS